ncbi:MAG: hypothetical protein I3273_02150 [Candidatus Moeniiplasma glomeromycotorum]|nr:hypothetical protein [Candidatus Moeniiplasma glomeromycotorum]MCE8167078.1 hypothetical protein [Candidatus Moeniiplasma glomeromycotorum]MCE8168910.1 hypothetical protein [Candidatus Moeniiplasma glomeromycotorum]
MLNKNEREIAHLLFAKIEFNASRLKDLTLAKSISSREFSASLRKKELDEEIFDKMDATRRNSVNMKKLREHMFFLIDKMAVGVVSYWEDLSIPNRIEELQKDKEIAELEAQTHLEALEKGEEWGKNQVNKLETDKEVLSNTILEKNDELDKQDHEIWQLEDKNQALAERIKQKTQTITNLQTKKNQADRQAKIQSKRYRKLVKNTKKLALRKTYFTNQHDLQRQTIQDLQTDLNQTQTVLDILLSHRDDLYLQLAQFSGELNSKQTAIQDLQNQVSQLEQEKENLEVKLLQKIGQLTTEQSKTKKLNTTKKIKSILAQKLRLDLDQKWKEVNSLTGQNNYWIEQDGRLRVTIQGLQSQINLKDSEIQNKNNQLSQKDTKLDKRKRTKKQLTATNQDYSQKLTEILSKKTQLLAQLEAYKENLSPSQHQTVIKKIITAKEQEIKQISTRLKQLEKEKEQIIQKNEKNKQRQNWLLRGSGTIIFFLTLILLFILRIRKRKVKK